VVAIVGRLEAMTDSEKEEMKACLEATKACLEKMEANQEKLETKMEAYPGNM
jgi:hypothetical protein